MLASAPSFLMTTPPKHTISRVLWTTFQWAALGIIIYCTVFAVVNVFVKLLTSEWFSDTRIASLMLGNQKLSNIVLFAHIATACPCILVGPFLFMQGFRNKHMKLHRFLGLIYVFTVIPSSITGFALALHNHFGIWARAGFATLAVVWGVTTVIAYYRVFQRKIFSHRRWMIRSYAITLAVLAVRFLAAPPDGWTREEWFPYVTWLCWVPNLIFAEIYLFVSDNKGRLRLSEFLDWFTKARQEKQPTAG